MEHWKLLEGIRPFLYPRKGQSLLGVDNTFAVTGRERMLSKGKAVCPRSPSHGVSSSTRI